MQLPLHVTHVEVMGPHFTKYHLSNGQVVHQFSAIDTGHHHDHPFSFTSTILWGGYVEEMCYLRADGRVAKRSVERRVGESHKVDADTVHLITALPKGECWTLITPGNWVQEPGFYTFDEQGIHHRYWNQDTFTLVTAKTT